MPKLSTASDCAGRDAAIVINTYTAVLRRSKVPAVEIAFLVGFDEPTSFYRAFRTWTGTTPDSVRAIALA